MEKKCTDDRSVGRCKQTQICKKTFGNSAQAEQYRPTSVAQRMKDSSIRCLANSVTRLAIYWTLGIFL